jgi:hypothetical protein
MQSGNIMFMELGSTLDLVFGLTLGEVTYDLVHSCVDKSPKVVC